MADWTKPFTASYRYMRVSRHTGNETARLDGMRGGSITVNNDTQTFESAKADSSEFVDVKADLVRIYLDATFEDGSTESVVLGTFLSSIPSRDISGSNVDCTMHLDGRLTELQEDSFDAPIVIPAGTNAVEYAKSIAEGAGLTVLYSPSSYTLGTAWAFGLDDSGDDEGGSKLDCINALLRMADYSAAKTDQWGRVLMYPETDVDAAPARWTFQQGANATFLDESTYERDTRDVCNVVLAVYETDEATTIGEAVDNDASSPWSVMNLGRRKVAKYFYNDTSTQYAATIKAQQLLRTNQSVVRRLTLSHVWCGARVGDVVRVMWPNTGYSGTYVIRTQDIDVGSAGCMCTSELRRFERG